MISKPNLALARRHGAQLIRYKQLPCNAQKAIIVYYHYEEEGTDADIHREEMKYNDLFGYGFIPTPIIKKAIYLRESALAGLYKSFEDYHKWYVQFGIPKYSRKSIWPCILSRMDDEIFEDGWHRFHRYVQLGLLRIPVLWLP